jgi:hypothetical protein
MKTRDRVLVLGLCGGTFCLAGAQCQNPSAARRTQIDAIIEEQSEAFAEIGGRDSAETRSAQLTAVASAVGAIRDAEDGQKVALASLKCAAQRELGLMRLAEASALDDVRRKQRAEIAHRITIAQLLHAVAEGNASLDLNPTLQRLQSGGADAEHDRRDSSLRMAELDGPIEDLRDGNNQDQAEVDRVSARASELRREAAALGPADGFDRFQQAIELEQQVDNYEVRMAYREITLDFDLQPEHQHAATLVDQASELIEVLATSEQAIDAFLTMIEQDASTTRAQVAALDQVINTAFDETLANDEVHDLFDEAITHLDQAVTAAGVTASGRGDEADAGRLVQARMQAIVGEAHMKRMRALLGRLTILEQLQQAGDTLSSASRAASAIETTKAALDAAEANANESFGDAQTTLSGVTSRTARQAADRLTASVGAALTTLGGGGGGAMPEQPMQLPTPAPDGGGAGGADSGAGDVGQP